MKFILKGSWVCDDHKKSSEMLKNSKHKTGGNSSHATSSQSVSATPLLVIIFHMQD